MAGHPEDHAMALSPEAVYTNYLQAGSTPREVILEFGQFHSGEKSPRIHTRLITHPAYVEEFLRVMAEALRQYKAATGIGEQPAEKVQ